MPRSTIANRRATIFDKALELRDYTAAAISATTAGTAISLQATKLKSYKCVVDVAAHTGFVATSAQWDITVEASTDNSTFKPVGTVTPQGTQNRFDLPLSGEWVEDIVSGALYVRVKATKTGSPGNLTYGAFLTVC
ncbi:hypothetical protein [Aulosira sp. FACHB-615]|uniref:hypothetical protein n=1 Tax=Aulosira sp. FACHB-615 TaxID=2692777 RepID=UPI0016852BE3|nr:hypothetical protein [Aulosira sp. FACHB-615]MBD2488998.1 hypothetical protein [Aulosira sp. FACHB-615]